MPRISADTVAEHVERQEAAVFEAALRLFLERGYAAVSLADIAAEVGLARNSLYRYFPDKAHILVRWLRHELPEQVAESERLLGGEGDPVERIRRWANYQLDYARQPEHGLIAAFPDVARNLDAATRAGWPTAIANCWRRWTGHWPQPGSGPPSSAPLPPS